MVRRRQAASKKTRHSGHHRASDKVAVAGSSPGLDKPEVDAEPQALVASFRFDSTDLGDTGPRTVRLTGRRQGTQTKPDPRDIFVHDETIEGVVPGSGRVSITATVAGLGQGEWMVSAELLPPPIDPRPSWLPSRITRSANRQLQPAVWSWRRWGLADVPSAPIKTRWALLAPLAKSPAVLPGSYTALAVLGIVIALATQAAIVAREGIPVSQSFLASLLGVVFGLIGAKLWYAVLHADESIIRGGWAVDGFLAVAPVAAVIALIAFDLPVGTVLDAVTPGLFFAVAIGRIGCFVTGCCAGRCTASRWGVWSSDRRVGARRIPTQLLESAAGLLIGILALLMVLFVVPPIHGVIFVAAFAVYGVLRQLLLRLRAEQRKSPRSLSATAVVFAMVSLALIVVIVARGS